MSEELKPCPFCGEAPKLEQRQTQSLWSSDEVTFSYVACHECEVSGRDFCDDPDGEQAIEWWNRRATLSPAHIEDGEEVDFAQVVTEKVKDAYHERESITEVVAAIVAQHQRIVAALASKAAARVEDERDAFEVYAKSRGWDGHHLKRNADNPERYDDWGVQPEWLAFKAGSEWRAALSAPPAADGMCNADKPSSRCECREEFGHRVCAAQPAAWVQKSVDPCPGCLPGGVCRTPNCGRLIERSKKKDGVNITDAPAGFKRPENPPPAPPYAPTPPASEQQRAVVMPEREVSRNGCTNLKKGYGGGWNACLDEFLRLNPHLAKGEGV